MIEPIDWTKFTIARIHVLRGLADNRSLSEIATDLHIEPNTVRGHVADLKALTSCKDVREIGRWWSQHAPEWLHWCALQAGLETGETVRTVG